MSLNDALHLGRYTACFPGAAFGLADWFSHQLLLPRRLLKGQCKSASPTGNFYFLGP